MQTFMPHKDFTKTAEALDSKRLNKQILECYQILKVLSNDDPHAGWRNHPAVKMWRGHEKMLWNYAMQMIWEASKRGIKTNTNEANIRELWRYNADNWGDGYPEWYEDDIKMKRLTTSHQANLYRKDPEFYFEFYPAVAKHQPCCPGRKVPCNYYWVTHEEAA